MHLPVPGFSLWATISTGLILLASVPRRPRKRKAPDSSTAGTPETPPGKKPAPKSGSARKRNEDSAAELLSVSGGDSGDGQPTQTIQVNLHVPSGSRVRLTVESLPPEGASGEEKVLYQTTFQTSLTPPEAVTAAPELVTPPPRSRPSLIAGLRGQLGSLASHLSKQAIWVEKLLALSRRVTARGVTLDIVLFTLAMVVYAATRLIRLEDFPIYFFTDEANQTLLAAALARDGLHDQFGTLLPTYFRNVYQFNLSLSVYAQLLPYLLSGKSIVVTRAVAALLTLPGAAAVGLLLRDIFRIRFWWIGVFVLSLTPAWFLHSRTAFETTMMVSFFACFLYFYLLYRTRSPRYIYLAIVFAALAFYSYAAGQVVMLAIALFLLFSDLRYHWENRHTLARGILLAAVFALPYLRFQMDHPDQIQEHLRRLDSFLVHDLTPGEKLAILGRNYYRGISPAYWYLPNEVDFSRHKMDEYGHISLWTLPLAIIGLIYLLRRLRESPARTVLAAAMVAPLGGAIVGIGIARVMPFVVPNAIITSLGAVAVANLLANRFKYLIPAISIFVLLCLASFGMLRDSLVNGPTWFTDYGIGGLQYGARQVADAVLDILEKDPEREVLISPTWANGADIVMEFMLPDNLSFRMGNATAFLEEKLDLTDQMLFILTPSEYDELQQSQKVSGLTVEETIPYPDGRTGFYLIHMHYSPQADGIFAQDREERRRPVLADVTIDGQIVHVEHSRLDIGRIEDILDGDPYTLARGYEANPFLLTLSFESPHQLSGISLTTGTMDFSITVRLYTDGPSPEKVFTETYRNLPADPTVHVSFGDSPYAVTKMEIEVQSFSEGEPAHIHLRELVLE